MVTGLQKNPRYMRRSAIVLRNPSRGVGEPHLPSANCPVATQQFALTLCGRVPEIHVAERHRSDCPGTWSTALSSKAPVLSHGRFRRAGQHPHSVKEKKEALY